MECGRDEEISRWWANVHFCAHFLTHVKDWILDIIQNIDMLASNGNWQLNNGIHILIINLMLSLLAKCEFQEQQMVKV